MLIYSIKGIDKICENVVRDRKGVNTSRLRGCAHHTIRMKLRGRHIGSSRIRYIRIPSPSRRCRHVTFSIKFRVIGPTRCRLRGGATRNSEGRYSISATRLSFQSLARRKFRFSCRSRNSRIRMFETSTSE